ncbi:MAG: sulfatase-like hydrolase/transferase [Candidatus Pacebacteria bacterium]|nr:sulfatase-like hydrolase/transferase [Candidatus Paceibacterota bacterium]
MASLTPPNILFFLPDQHRPDWLGFNSDLPVRTPNLDRLRASGVQFRNAFTPSPLCAPARACLASGLEYERCRVPSNRENYPVDLPTYCQRLRDAGYRVCGVGKFDLHKDLATPVAELDWHLDGSRSLEEWGFTEGIDNEGKIDGSSSYKAAGKPKGPYLHYLCEQGLADTYVREHEERQKYRDAYVTSLPEEAYCDNWVSENGLSFLHNFPTDQPWHLVVNFTGPHNPMDVTQRMHDAWKDVQFPMPVENEQEDYSVDDHQRNRRYYAAMIENIDRQVGRFLDAVEERGELERTLVVYASDHGEMLGDHNLWGKSTWYTPASGIPLIVAGPGMKKGVSNSALTSLHDLTATFLDYARTPPLPSMDARSLRPVLEGKTEQHREYVVSGLNGWRMLFDGRYKLVTRQDAPPLLYDLQEDPQETNDIASANPHVVNTLAAFRSLKTRSGCRVNAELRPDR